MESILSAASPSYSAIFPRHDSRFFWSTDKQFRPQRQHIHQKSEEHDPSRRNQSLDCLRLMSTEIQGKLVSPGIDSEHPHWMPQNYFARCFSSFSAWIFLCNERRTTRSCSKSSFYSACWNRSDQNVPRSQKQYITKSLHVESVPCGPTIAAVKCGEELNTCNLAKRT